MTKNLTKPNPAEFGFTTFTQLIGKRDPVVGEADLPFYIFHNELAASLKPMTPYEAVIAENLIAIEWELLQHRRMRDATLREMTVTAIRDAVVEREHAAWDEKVDAEYEAWVAAKKEEDDLEEDGSDSKAAEGTEDDVEDDGSDTKAADEVEALYKRIVGDKQTAEAEEVEEEDFEHEAFDRDAARKLGADLARRIVDPAADLQSKAEEELIELGLSALEIMGEAYRSRERGVTDHDEKIQELERRRRSVKADFDALQKARPVDVEVIEG